MARGYGQYCPLALATELLAQRWTLLIVSRLIEGFDRFNAIHRGVPRISPSLLSQRLRELDDAGILERQEDERGIRYVLTPAGRDLGEVILQMAVWGQHWARDMIDDDLDPGFLAWSMHTRMDVEAMPPGRLVLEFVFTGAPRDCRRFWLLKEEDAVEMCLKHPGFETDLRIDANLRLFIEIWRGFRGLEEEIRAGRIRLRGPAKLKRQFPSWLRYHVLAGTPRHRPGRENRLG